MNNNSWCKSVKRYYGSLNNCWKWMNNKTFHIDNERLVRSHVDVGFQIVLAAFVVDRGHKDGNEIHFITSKGMIYIFNERTHRYVTVLIARPHQFLRYFKSPQMAERNKSIHEAVECCKQHQLKGMNNL